MSLQGVILFYWWPAQRGRSKRGERKHLNSAQRGHAFGFKKQIHNYSLILGKGEGKECLPFL